jgi:glyoxylase-like metal-dependent hydrolase (beta-lactamase superfamily II)
MSVALDAGDTVFFFAADASCTQQLMLDGEVDGVSPDPSTARATLASIQQLVAGRLTVYLPSHDPDAITRLTHREVADSARLETA